MGNTKKPAGTTVDRRNGRRAEELTAPGERFDPPDGLTPLAAGLWEDYWADRVSGTLTPVDRAVLIRWITAYDRYFTTLAAADLEPLVDGHTGQPRLNPLFKLAEMHLMAAERAEKQLGVGSLNRTNLGIAIVTERQSLDTLNARYGGGDASPAAPAVDPRTLDV